MFILFGCNTRGNAQEVPRVQFGIAGHYRVGCWTGVRVTDSGLLKELSAAETILATTMDGDGVPVEYRFPTPAGPREFIYLIPGSEAAPLVLGTSEAENVFSARFPLQQAPSRGPAMLPLRMPWIVASGSALGIDEIGANKILKRDASVAVSAPQVDEFPDNDLGYQGVDLILINGSSYESLAQLSETQRSAMVDWVQGGGRMLLTLGSSSKQLAKAAPWLMDMLPVGSGEVEIRTMDPSALETYTSSQNPLKPFQGAVLPRESGRILITGRTNRRVSTPFAVEYGVGFGHITVMTTDLDTEDMEAWPERMDLLKRLTGSLLVESNNESSSRATAYDDLAGQMRASLDQFAVKRAFPFSIVALILMALIAAIGPIDYLLINRVFGRPLLGWVTFPIMAIGLSAVLIHMARPVAPDTNKVDSENVAAVAADENALVRCNRIEILDIDSIANVGRGFSWSYLYCHSASQFDVHVQPSSFLEKSSDQINTLITAPFGYPGHAFGGIQIVGKDPRFPVYGVDVQQSDQETTGVLSGLSLAPRSSKSIATWAKFKPTLSDDIVVKRRPGSELLNGSLKNPLSDDLLEGLLVYRNWVYFLPTRFRAGSTIKKIGDLRQKPFKWRLTKKTALDNNRTDNEAWSPSDFDNPDRVGEMLMFYKAAGADRYVNLQHSVLSFLDRSDVLSNDRCILFGKLKAPATQLDLTSTKEKDAQPFSPNGEQFSFVRLVMPVEVEKRDR